MDQKYMTRSELKVITLQLTRELNQSENCIQNLESSIQEFQKTIDLSGRDINVIERYRVELEIAKNDKVAYECTRDRLLLELSCLNDTYGHLND